jgi:uncharacterized protein
MKPFEAVQDRTPIVLRDAADTDFVRIVELNEAEVRQTSAMSFDRLRSLVAISAHCRVATSNGFVVAFLLAFRNGAAYDSDNYRWFASRLGEFLYVDRIVVGKAFAGRGVGAALYADLFAFARSQGIDTIACEYNIDPPNPASRAFHDKFGFTEVGTQWVANRSKRVSLQIAHPGPGSVATTAGRSS